jgi:hypothetical protein
MSNSATEATDRPILKDRAAQISLGLAIILNLFLFLLIILAYQRLNEAVAAYSVAVGDTAAAVDLSATPNAGGPFNVLVLPIIGLVGWLVGGVVGAYYYSARADAPMAYIVWASAVLIGLATWLPALSLIMNL